MVKQNRSSVVLIAACVLLEACRPSPREELVEDAGPPSGVFVLDAAPPPSAHVMAFAPTVNGPTAYWSFVNVEGQKASYSISFTNLAMLSTLTMGVIGSATKTVKIVRIKIGPSYANVPGKQFISLNIESPLPTGGSPSSGNGFRFDTKDSNSSAQWVFYSGAASACPGGCTRLDNPRNEVLYTVGIGLDAGFVGNTIEWDFCAGVPERCPTLRSATELAVLSADGTIAGQNTAIDIDWTEE